MSQIHPTTSSSEQGALQRFANLTDTPGAGYAGGANATNIQNFLLANNTGSFTTNAYADAPATLAAFTGTRGPDEAGLVDFTPCRVDAYEDHACS